MGPKKSKVVTLKISPSKLKEYSFSDSSKKKKLLSVKATAPASPASIHEENTGTSTPIKNTPGPRPGLGAVNAQLRALDRTGKPCRKWTKQPIHLKSFTGFKYTLYGWNGGPKEIGHMEQNGKKSKKEVKNDKESKNLKEESEEKEKGGQDQSVATTSTTEATTETVKVES